LKADISPLASEPNIREYIVEVEYRTKADAKAAVACLAAEQGLIDLLRFNGAQPPPDYTPFWEAQMNGSGDNYVGKRKEPERDLDGEGRDRKKRRKSNKDGFEPGEVPDVKVKQDFEHSLPSKTVTISSPMAGPSLLKRDLPKLVPAVLDQPILLLLQRLRLVKTGLGTEMEVLITTIVTQSIPLRSLLLFLQLCIPLV
jgi:hypothetical protein